MVNEKQNITGNGVALDLNGTIIVVGMTQGSMDGQSSFGSDDIYLVRFDSNGNKQ